PGVPRRRRPEPPAGSPQLPRGAQSHAEPTIDGLRAAVENGGRREPPLIIPPIPPPGDITWVKVEKPVFDLVGVVLSSFKLAGLVAGVALVLGAPLGLSFPLPRRALPG